MKKLFLERVSQDHVDFYVGIADPRDLIRMVKDIEIGVTQDAQRPISESKVKEIAKYVADDSPYGILPTSVTLGTRDRYKLDIHVDSDNSSVGSHPRYYVEFPETADEFANFKDTIDVMDGQHRLFAFKDCYRLLSDSEPYDVLFALFKTPSLELRRRIFMTTNEKQDKVSSNLLMWFRSQLSLLRGAEKDYAGIVSKLNSEVGSPLQNRIIMSAEKISKGYKAQQIIKIFDKAQLKDLSTNGRNLDDNQLTKLVSEYLSGWESYYDVNYQQPKQEDGAKTKISGIRYAILLLPVFWDYSIKKRTPFTKHFVHGVLQHLSDAIDLGYDNNVFSDPTYSLAFRSEGATVKLADEHGKKLELHLQQMDETMGFDPLG